MLLRQKKVIPTICNYFCITMSRIIKYVANIMRIREPTRENETEEERQDETGRSDEEMNEKCEGKKRRKGKRVANTNEKRNGAAK